MLWVRMSLAGSISWGPLWVAPALALSGLYLCGLQAVSSPCRPSGLLKAAEFRVGSRVCGGPG